MATVHADRAHTPVPRLQDALVSPEQPAPDVAKLHTAVYPLKRCREYSANAFVLY